MTLTSDTTADVLREAARTLDGIPVGHVIAGNRDPAGSGAPLPVVDPASGRTIAEIPRGDAAVVDRAVDAARSAFPAWRATPLSTRARTLTAVADVVEEHVAELVALESLNTGKPLPVAQEEIPLVAEVFRFMAGAARALQSPATEEYVPGHLSVLRREPVGVVGAVTPWNYPLLTASWKVAAALAMGNTVVLKPSELTPLTTLRFMDLVTDVLPPGVLNVVLGTGQDVGAPIARHAGVDLVSLTGSVESGRHVMRDAAQTLKPTHLELGGKAPVVVFDDADVDLVVAGVRSSGYWNSGQECGAATRVLCAEQVRDRLVEQLTAAVAEIVVGPPSEGDGVEMGPLISAQHRERVAALVARAKAEGAVVAVGGEPTDREGFFYPPTLITDAGSSREITTQEIFGPVVTVESFAGEDEAVARANGVEYGLAASVWTENVGRALRVSGALNFGTVWVNSHLVLATEMPWGGFGASGHGRELSTLSLDDFSRTKHVMVATGRGDGA